jgi:hypothetical protein
MSAPEEIEITAEEILAEAEEIRADRERKPDNDPVEYLPVMRHHLHEALWALDVALGHAQAQDLAESYRDGLTAPRNSPLSRQLERSHTTLAAYLGLLDEGDDDGQEPVSKDE